MALRLLGGSAPLETNTLKVLITLGDSVRGTDLFSNEGENCLLFSLTDADGIQDLTSCFGNFTSPGLVHQFAGLLELLRTQTEALFPALEQIQNI